MAILKLTRESLRVSAMYTVFVPLIARKSHSGSSNWCKESFGENAVMLSKLSCTWKHFFFLRKKLVCSFEGKTKNFERLSKEQHLEPGAVCQPMCNHVLYQRENQGYCNATVGSTLTLPLPHMQVPHIHQTTTPPKRFPDSWRAFLYLSFLIWKIKRQQGFFCMTKRLWR